MDKSPEIMKTRKTVKKNIGRPRMRRKQQIYLKFNFDIIFIKDIILCNLSVFVTNSRNLVDTDFPWR